MSRFLSFLQAVGGVVSILAVLGYAALRAGVNYLGLSMLGTLPIERYLQEVYALLGSIALFSMIGASAIVAGLPIYLCRPNHDRTHAPWRSTRRPVGTPRLAGVTEWLPDRGSGESGGPVAPVVEPRTTQRRGDRSAGRGPASVGGRMAVRSRGRRGRQRHHGDRVDSTALVAAQASRECCRRVVVGCWNSAAVVLGDSYRIRRRAATEHLPEGGGLLESNIQEPINLGSAEMVSINQLVDYVEEIAKHKLERKYDPSAPKGVRGRNSDNTLIRQYLGWEPSIPLKDGLKKTYDWIKEQMIENKGKDSKKVVFNEF